MGKYLNFCEPKISHLRRSHHMSKIPQDCGEAGHTLARGLEAMLVFCCLNWHVYLSDPGTKAEQHVQLGTKGDSDFIKSTEVKSVHT